MDNKLSITITYSLANGKTVEISVPIDVAEALEDMDRQLRTQGRTDRRFLYKGEFSEENPELSTQFQQEDISEVVGRLEDYAQLQKAFCNLSAVQKRRIRQHFFEGLSFRQISRNEGVSENSVRESVKTALKKIKIFF